MESEQQPSTADRATDSMHQKMRILLLTHWLSSNGGGVTTVVKETAREMSRRSDVDIHVIGLTENPKEATGDDWGAAHVHALMTARAWRRVGYAGNMAGLLEELDADVVHVHGLWTYASLAACKWRGRHPDGRMFISPHGMLETWALLNGRWKKIIFGAAFQRRALRMADGIHALTAAEADDIRRYTDGVLVAVVPNGVSIPSKRTPATVQSGAKEKSLLYLGRLHPKKNLPLLLRAWANAGSATAGWHLRIAGWDQGGHRAELESLCMDLGIGRSVSFAGALFRTQRDEAYEDASAVVLPSLSEGLPMVVLEAWSHARPVLMTDACNLPEGFATGAAVRLRTDDISAVQDLAAFLGLSGECLTKVGKAGFALVSRTHTWDVVTCRLLAMYRGAFPSH